MFVLSPHNIISLVTRRPDREIGLGLILNVEMTADGETPPLQYPIRNWMC